MSDTEETEKGLKELAVGALKLAKDDPDAFVQAVKLKAQEAGAVAEHVYEKVAQHPDQAKREVRNQAIQRGADWLLKRFGL